MPAANVMQPELSDDDQKKLEWLLVDFDQQWRDGSLADHAGRLDAASPLRARALAEMIKIDLERQWGLGRPTTVESYLTTYPELGTPETVSAELIQAEFQVRRQFDEPTALDDCCRRFPRQAAELRRLIEESKLVVSDTELLATSTSTVSFHKSPDETPRDAAVHEAPTQPPVQPIASPVKGTTAAGWSIRQLPEKFGRYRILKCLGQGGMGAVYLAHDTQLDRQVAMKIPHFAADAGTAVLERFYRESRAAATLDHPNICPVYDVGRIDGIHYLVMAYIEGKMLSEFAKPDNPIPPRQVAAIIRKLALALQEAHDHGVVHRDLKPANIMVNKRRELVIMDFGLARILKKSGEEESRLTQSGAVMGTPAYMSPEQVMGDAKAIGPATDIYSLGVIMYELLTGRLPFRGVITAVLAQIVVNEPPRPISIRPDIDPALEAICLKAMAKKIDARYGSMRELADGLTKWLQGARAQSETSDLKSEAGWVESSRPTDLKSQISNSKSQEVGLEASTHPTPPPVARDRRAFGKRIAAVAAALLVATLGFAAFEVYRIQTDKGTLVVEINDADVEAKLKKDGLVVEDRRTGRKFTVQATGERRERSGDYTVSVAQGLRLAVLDDQGLEVETNEFKLTRGGNVRVRVTLEDAAGEAVTESPKTPPAVKLTGKLPAPPADRVAELQRAVRDAMKTELASGKPADLSRAAQSFLTRAAALDDPEDQFALLDLARDLAAQAGDLREALDACARLDREFLIDPVAVKVRTLQRLAQAGGPPDAEPPLLDAVLAAGFEALAADNYGPGRDAAKVAADLTARPPGRATYAYQARFLAQELERAESAYERLPATAKNEAGVTNDPDTNTARGRFAWLVKNDWTRGADFMRGGVAPWRALAEREEKRPAAAADRAALGDQWWQAADGLPTADALDARRRARYWYLGALAQMNASEREEAAAELQPRIDQVLRTPINLRVRMTGLSGYHTLRISSDGVRTVGRGSRKITKDIQVNHLRWTDQVTGHRNAGATRLLPDGVDFSTTQLVQLSHSRWGAAHITVTPEYVDLQFWHAPSNETSSFDVTLTVEAAGYDLPSRFARQWDVAYYNWPEKAVTTRTRS